ncbi:MAG: AlpA family phage regulatory protein [Tissierellales bacterium]
MVTNIFRLPTVKQMTGRSRSAVYKDIAAGLFTKPVSIGARAVGWPANEVATINAARIAGKSPAEIQELVKALEAARKELGKGGLA